MSDQHPDPWDHEHESYEDSHEHLNNDDEGHDQDYVDEEDEEDEEYLDTEEAFGLEIMLEAFSGDEAADDDADDAENTLHSTILRFISGEHHDPFFEQPWNLWASWCKVHGTDTERKGQTGGPGYLTHSQVLALLRGQDPRQVMFDDDDDDGYDDDDYLWGRRRRRGPRKPLDPDRFPKVPSEAGRKLMESGVFGAFDPREPDTKRLARRILDRELGLGSRAGRKATHNPMAQEMIPSTTPEMIIHYDDPVCCGQFSDDGNFFYSCVKDYRVRLYDTSNPYNWRHYKTVTYPFGQWILTDAALSPDNRWLAFTSLQSSVCFAPTDPNDTGDPYSLELGSPNQQTGFRFRGSFSIFSVRFSGDGRNLIAGTRNDSIVVYDIERRQAIHNVRGHDEDVNAVCFADKMSPHILYSGSDDCTVKVWDTRSLGDGRAAGAFVGHVEGITYIDSKGDGRYILSNGKDQSMKLWDLRMAMSCSDYERIDASKPTRTREYRYDYRGVPYDEDEWFQHPHDNSLVTFRGHQVQGTLIRCHFSPPGSTDSRYVYSGSYDGFVYIWNMDATLKAKIDIKGATESVRHGGRNQRYRLHHHHDSDDPWVTLVRDVGWHPNAPLLVASAWNGFDGEAGTASLHSFNENDTDEAEPGMGLSVNEKLAPVEF